MFIYRGAHRPLRHLRKMGIDTAKDRDWMEPQEISEKGIHVEQSMLINKPAEELYRYWRNFENLPAIMTHLISVRVMNDGRSHWVAKAPKIAGGQVEWDAEITADEQGSLIGWRSLPGSQVDHVGQIRFAKALGDRGTKFTCSWTTCRRPGSWGIGWRRCSARRPRGRCAMTCGISSA
jgi:uncharacterized membrane protein